MSGVHYIVVNFREIFLNRCVPVSLTRRIEYVWSAINSLFNVFDDNLIEVSLFSDTPTLTSAHRRGFITKKYLTGIDYNSFVFVRLSEFFYV